MHRVNARALSFLIVLFLFFDPFSVNNALSLSAMSAYYPDLNGGSKEPLLVDSCGEPLDITLKDNATALSAVASNNTQGKFCSVIHHSAVHFCSSNQNNRVHKNT